MKYLGSLISNKDVIIFVLFAWFAFTRGREISERPELIVAKCKAMLKDGAKEITLLGQNVNSYGLDLVANNKLIVSERGPFVDLIRAVSDLPGLESLRLTTSNPHDFTRPLAEVFAEKTVLGKYFHLPVQSGSDHILKVMKRKVTVAEYLEKINWLRQAVPDMALSTDIIVGFQAKVMLISSRL